MSTHVVLGAGSVGGPLTRELSRRGHRVICVNGPASRRGPFDATENRVGDVTDPEFICDVLRGADVVYQLSSPHSRRCAERLSAAHLAVLDAAAATSTRVVVADDLGSGGPPGGPLTGASPGTASNAGPRARTSVAEKALAAHRAGRVGVALARCSHLFGADHKPTRDLLAGRAIAGRRMAVLGRLDEPHAFAYVPDVVRAMADLGASDDAWGRSWVLPALAPLSQRELCLRLWQAAGRTGYPKVSALRGPRLRFAGMFAPDLRHSAAMLDEFEHPFLVDASEFEGRFHWSATAIDDAIRQTVHDTRPTQIVAST